MRRDTYYLTDILEAAEAIEGYLLGVDEGQFFASGLLKDAILMRLTQVGEACARLSEPFKMAYPHVPWRKVHAFRNIAVHAYFSVDWAVVWQLATVRVPELAEQVTQILDDDGRLGTVLPVIPDMQED